MTMHVSVSAVDLFCGVGGLTHGLIKSGIPVNTGVDTDESCGYVYEKNNPSRYVNISVKNLSGAELKKMYPHEGIKILAGCAPCQPFSAHTQKNKDRKKDEKWGLLYEFSRLIKEIEPEIVTMENVVRMMRQKVFGDFIDNLKSIGYYVFWKSVYCPDYGVPQSRRRLVLLASKLGKIEIIPPTHDSTRYKTAWDAIGKLEAIENGGVSAKDPLHRASKLSAINLKRIRCSKPGGSWLDWDKDLRAPCHRKKSGRTYSAVYSRMSWGKPSPTITTQFNRFGTGRFGHPTQDRALSLREGALLQTFPKYYKLIDPNNMFSFKRIGTHIGNAVPVRLGFAIGHSILKHLGELCDNK